MNKLKLRVIDDWKAGWKWVSTQALAIGAGINGAWVAVPDELKSNLPPKLLAYASLVIFASGLIGRFVTTAPTATEAADVQAPDAS